MRKAVALREDPETAAWMREKGDANAGREARRIFEAAGASGPLIKLRGGQLHNEATAGEDALLAAGKPIYQRGNDLVRPAEQLVPASRGRTTRSACLIGVSAHGLVDHLCGAATWERFDARANEWIEVNPPMAVAQTILSRAGDWRFPRIAGVITTPTLRPDGSILAAPGYDLATRLYHLQDPDLQLHAAVKAPTRANAEAALKLLNALLDEFPFVDPVSRSVALSGLITPVVRGALSVVPLHAFKAYTAGTGKSYLADVASAISTGRPCPVASAAPDEAETEKRLVGLLLAGFPISSLDNVNGELGGDLLCQAIERPLVRIRPLGRSDIVEIESRSTIFATGNNLRVRGDMVRRTILCSLDAGVERPELREFKADPIATVMADRGRYVSACLIIVRAYAAAGRPDVLKPIASFEDWSNAVRSALVWLG
ncbi:MAG: topoisomerase, partial [Acetobacteraceae bacterium]